MLGTMSSSISRLSRHFCTQVTTSNPKLKITSTDIKSLFKEPNLIKVASTFKQFSDIRSFRGRFNLYEKIILRLATANQQTLVEDILEHQKTYDDIKREGFAIRLIHLYGKAGMPKQAHKVFDEMPQRECERTVKSLNAVLNAYAQAKKYDEVVKLFTELALSHSIKHDDRTYNVVIRALCEKKELDSAEKMLDEMESNGVKPIVHTFNILIDAFNSNERFEDAERVWGRMEKAGIEPDLVSFNGKIKGWVHEGKMSEAVELLDEIERRKMKPDCITYNSLIRGYCNNGDFDEAKGVYDHLMKSDCLPNRTTYQLMIPCCCKKGDSGLAFELSKECMKESLYINVEIFQTVVDLLVKDSKVEEAEELMNAYVRKYKRSKLKMPALEE